MNHNNIQSEYFINVVRACICICCCCRRKHPIWRRSAYSLIGWPPRTLRKYFLACRGSAAMWTLLRFTIFLTIIRFRFPPQCGLCFSLDRMLYSTCTVYYVDFYQFTFGIGSAYILQLINFCWTELEPWFEFIYLIVVMPQSSKSYKISQEKYISGWLIF